MIARIADHLFWFGRYVERADNAARLLFVTGNLALDAELPAAEVWRPVLITCGEEGPFIERLGEAAAADGDVVQRALTWDSESWVSLRATVTMARDNARAMRDVISLEVWQAINEVFLWFGTDEAAALYASHRYDFYRHIQRATQLILGLTRSTMLHDSANDLIWLGVLLERTGQIARMLDVHHHALAVDPDAAKDAVVWIAVLRACCAFEPYMKRRPGQVTGPAVANFVLFDSDFPRSIRFAARSAYASLARIRPPEARDLPGGKSLERLRVLMSYLDDLATSQSLQSELHSALTHVVDEVTAIGALLSRELFGRT
jgi:uncharacterized alpha-E superfamily protein